jgi:hypothetical protein
MAEAAGKVTRVEELSEITSSHVYTFSLKTLTWGTLAITALMGLLYFAIGFPPAFDTFYESMYFHAVGIGLAALAAYLVMDTFDLQRYEPPMDFPISYRAFIGVAFAAVGGILTINPTVWKDLPDLGMLFYLTAFILLFDVGGALFIELLLLPRKQANAYCCESHNVVEYVGRILPIATAERQSYAKVGVGYWLTLAAVGSAFLAGVVGFVNLWVRALGPSIFGGYMGWLKLDANGFLGATLDPHTHMMALAIMAGIVSVAAVRFGVLDGASSVRRTVAHVGLWISVFGVAAMTVILLAVAFLNFTPPTLFASGKDGINGIAGDDASMSLIGIGAMVLVVAVLAERRFWRDPLRLMVLATWVAAVAINIIEGFYIELNENQFQAALTKNDAAYSVAQPMTGVFLLIAVSLALLLVDHYEIAGGARRLVAWVAGIGLLVTLAGVTLWTFADPSHSGIPFVLYVAGVAICYLLVLVGAWAIWTARTGSYRRTYP